MQTVTPITDLGILEGNHIFVKRDDLLPFSFGGNKVRIAQEYFADMKQKGCNCLIGYGNARSNLCRVLANMSKANGIPCHIVTPADDDGERVVTANSTLVHSCGVTLHTCLKQNVRETVEEAMQACAAEGLQYYYIYGDSTGSTNKETPVRAYAKVYHEIAAQAAEMQLSFDTVFLATGTGMTHSGLLAGAAEAGVQQEIVGISVARQAEQEAGVIRNYLDAYFAAHPIAERNDSPVIVTDHYLCGGYGKYDSGISDAIRMAYHRFGMPLDPTYSGKGFHGMLAYLREQKRSGQNILFLHTGGTPLFFDYLSKCHQ